MAELLHPVNVQVFSLGETIEDVERCESLTDGKPGRGVRDMARVEPSARLDARSCQDREVVGCEGEVSFTRCDPMLNLLNPCGSFRAIAEFLRHAFA